MSSSSSTQPSHSVKVTGFSASTTEAKLHDFFGFCGKITAIDFAEKSAVIHFEKPSAAKTALMLNGGTLEGGTLSVTADAEIPHHEDDHDEDRPIDQSDKPRAGIMAEFLAKGYMLQDHILQRAIEMDTKQGISKRFLNYFNKMDSTLGARALGPDQTISGKIQSHITAATQQAKAMDSEKGYSKMATDYYHKALSSPLGRKVFSFYTTTSKQVKDIHDEARRIMDMHKSQAPTATSSAPAPAPGPAPTTTKAPETETKA